MTYPKSCTFCSHPNSPDAPRCVLCTAEFPALRPCSDETADTSDALDRRNFTAASPQGKTHEQS